MPAHGIQSRHRLTMGGRLPRRRRSRIVGPV